MDTFKAAIKIGTYTSGGGSSGHDSSTGVSNITPPTNAEPPSTAKIDAKTNADQNGIEIMEQVRDHTDVIDLSYTLEPNMPAWPTQARYGAIVYESYDFGDEARCVY